MQALILAAGRGSRLSDCARGKPKCLIEVGGKPLIDHQLNVLRGVGITRICVVTEYCAEQISCFVARRGQCIANPDYAKTNSVYSLSLARDWVAGPFVMLNSDVLAHPEVYRRVMSAEGTALAYDSASGDQQEHMKVSFEGGRLRAIGKGLSAEESDGENVGILRFDRKSAELLFREACAIVASGGAGRWAPAAVGRIADRVHIRGVDVAGLP